MPLSHRDEERKKVFLILLLLAVATTMKLYWAANSVGTPDTFRFFKIGTDLVEKGPSAVYASDPRWNQTISVTFLIQGLIWLASGSSELFVLLFRVPGILGDIAVVVELILLRHILRIPWPWLALAAISPINILVCGFHGNLDGLVAAGMFLALSAAVRGNPLLSGVWLGLACHVKVAPVLLAPLLAAYWLRRGGLFRFCTAFGTLGVLLVGSGIAIAGVPFIKHVLGYGSLWGFWGISEVLNMLNLTQCEVPLFGFRDPIAGKIATTLKVTIIGISCWLAWIGRHGKGRDLMRVAAATLLVFFALTPGFGHQYMVWWFAVLLVAAPVWCAMLTLASTVFLIVYYATFATTPFPWVLVMPDGPLPGATRYISVATWLGFVVAAVVMVAKVWKERNPEEIESMQSKGLQSE